MLCKDAISRIPRVSSGLGALLLAGAIIAGCSETTYEPLTIDVVKVVVEAGQRSIREGETTQLTARVYSRYGYELERSVTWSSNRPELATVDANGLVAGVLGGWPEISATVEGVHGSVLVTVEEYPRTLEMEEVPALEVGETAGPVATVRCGRGHPMDVPLAWTTANAQVAQVSRTGQVLGVGPGVTTVTAEGAGLSESIQVEVKEPAVWLMLSAATTRLLRGQQAGIEATPRGSALNSLNRPITWSSSDPSRVSVDAGGMVTALAPGPATIRASADGAVGVLGFIVEEPVGMVWMAFSPAPVRPAAEVLFTVQTRTAAGALLAGRLVNWSTSDPSVATIEATGELTAHAPGTVAVIAESEGAQASSTLTVEGWIATLELEPELTLLSQGTMGQFMATARDAAGNFVHPVFAWSSSNPSVLSVGRTGGVAALEPGVATITASAEGHAISATVEVLPVEKVVRSDHVVLDRDWVERKVGGTVQLSARAFDVAGNEIQRPMVWASSDESIATVDETGLVTAVSPGIAKVTVTCDEKTDEVTIEVLPVRGPAVWIQVKETMVVYVGESVKVEAVAYDEFGPLSEPVKLHTTTPDRVRVEAGRIVGLMAGVAWVWVCCDELATPIRVIVKEGKFGSAGS